MRRTSPSSTSKVTRPGVNKYSCKKPCCRTPGVPAGRQLERLFWARDVRAAALRSAYLGVNGTRPLSVPKLSFEASLAPPSKYSTHTPDQSGRRLVDSQVCLCREPSSLAADVGFGLQPPRAIVPNNSSAA